MCYIISNEREGQGGLTRREHEMKTIYTDILNQTAARMRDAYQSHDIDAYNAIKRSGDELYAALIDEGYEIAYDAASDTYEVTR